MGILVVGYHYFTYIAGGAWDHFYGPRCLLQVDELENCNITFASVLELASFRFKFPNH